MIIAIDGPSASGKGTLARRLAAHFGLAHLETGLLYRAIGLKTLETAGDAGNKAAALEAAKSLDPAAMGPLLTKSQLREEWVAEAASKVAAMPEVRNYLIDFQREFSRNPGQGYKGAVLDGRDIGTVVCPGATAKFFLTASPEIRARRRLGELQGAKGGPPQELQGRESKGIPSAVSDYMATRDRRDSERQHAPLTVAGDALLLDTSDMDPDQVFAAAVAHIAKCLENEKD